MSRVLPMSNTSETLLSGSTVTTQIEVPSKVFNLSRSTLDFRMDYLKTASEYINVYCLGAPIDSIVLQSREGAEIARVDSADIYGSLVLPYLVRLEDFLSHPDSRGVSDATIATAQAAAETTADKGFNLFPNGEALADTTPTVACGRNGTRLVAGLCAANNVAYREMQYFIQSTVSENISVNFSFPLKYIAPHTVMSLDRDLYFGQNLLLNVNWASKQATGFATTSATNMATGLAVVTANINIVNIRVYLAVETNQQIANVIMQKVNSEGLKLYVPFVRTYLYSSAASTGPVMSQRVNLSNGQRLLCVYNACLHTTSTLSTRFDASNLVQIKVTSYQNQVNSLNLSENRINCQNGEDWQAHQELCKGSCIQSANIYAHRRLNIMSFRDGPCCEWLDRDGVVDGIDLSEEQTITVDQTTVSAAYRNYMFVVTQKLLSIAPGGVVSVQ